MTILFPTKGLEAKERFDYWQDVVGAQFVPTTNRQLSDDCFDGSLTSVTKGTVSFSRIRSLPIEYTRQRSDDHFDHYFISLSFCAEAYVQQGDRLSKQGTGDIVLYDSARPFTASFPKGDDQVVLGIPRPLVMQHIPDVERYLNRTLQSHAPLSGLARSLLVDTCNSESTSSSISERLNAALLDVLAVAYESAFGGHKPATEQRREQQVEQVKRFLLANLARSDLTVDSIAAANHLSPRSLNRIFAAQSSTVMRWLWQQRLAACHAGLVSGRFQQVSVAALSCGFTNFSHFSKAFKQAYGVPAQQLLTGA
ncbi:helix-turn-helix domain-containing protein [Pantoea sp. Ap-967]|uniref:helix-turn-helix domain-containing protein n=1 Tax=Pantoea sp. Ap-967 TaxID=2608362 RepID=UPI001421BFDD|nr:helix-turn-helix domain-containing protein [Pantoea sp. Ap-967]NIE73081.1 helix-turn-helix domain-containing protein [Pantoea sp. Ap-967]